MKPLIQRTYWRNRIRNLFELDKDMKLVKNRYKCLRVLLQKDYADVIKSSSPDTIEQMLKDVIYLDRQIRYQTEDVEQEEKEILSQEKVIELGYIDLWRN